MTILGIDVGSSSVKAAILRAGRISGRIARVGFATRFEGVCAEVDPAAVLAAMAEAIGQLGPAAKRVEHIGLTAMAPSWIAMDKRGEAVTPIVTHQDRRSVEVARELRDRLGGRRWLALAGNLPFPGSISCTTWAWFLRHQAARMRKADLVGHLNTYLHRQLTGARVTDTSNASFMGVFSTLRLNGWNPELCEAVGADPRLLPEVRQANEIGGMVLPSMAQRMGLTAGTPMIVGCMDTSAALFLAGMERGRLLNVSGSTDVLALCTDRPRPHERLLTRAVGVGRWWMSVSTIAAAGSSLVWLKQQVFPDWPMDRYRRLMAKLAERPMPSTVRFEPYLAGDRMSIEQRQGTFSGLTLATTREHLLSAVIEALAEASAARLPLLQRGGVRMRRSVMVSGGLDGGLHKVLHRDWPGQWQFHQEDEATLRGLGRMPVEGRRP